MDAVVSQLVVAFTQFLSLLLLLLLLFLLLLSTKTGYYAVTCLLFTCSNDSQMKRTTA